MNIKSNKCDWMNGLNYYYNGGKWREIYRWGIVSDEEGCFLFEGDVFDS